MKSHHQDNTDLLDGPAAPSAKKSGETGDPSISQASLPTDSQVAKRLSQNHQDIICGRGLHIMNHNGNQKLHRIVNKHRLAYQSAVRREKFAIANRIVDEIKKSGSRFIRKVEDGREDEWEEVDDETAYRKVGHCLRLRKNFQPSTETGDRSMSRASLITFTDAQWAAQLSENAEDIICGRGLHIMTHIGNQKLHRIVNRHRLAYHSATRREKAAIAQRIVNEIKSSGTRFIRKVAGGGDDEWEEVDNETAYKKVGHALRLRQKQQPESELKETTQVDALNHGSSAGSFDQTVSAALGRIEATLPVVPQNHIVHVPSILPPTYWFHQGMEMALASQLLVDRPQIHPSILPPLANPYSQLLMVNPLFASMSNAPLLATVGHASTQTSQVAAGQGTGPREPPADNGRSHPNVRGML